MLLRLDVAAVMESGLELVLAENGVLLCAGPVPVRYVQQINRHDLPDSWRREGDKVK